MVSLKHLFLLAISLADTIVAVPHPRSDIPDWSLALRDSSGKDTVSPLSHAATGQQELETTELLERQPARRGQMLLQWAPQGLMMFLLGWDSQAVIDILTDHFRGAGQGAPGRVLLEQFWYWLNDRHGEALNDNRYGLALDLLRTSKTGGVYGKSGFDSVDDGSYGDFGFGIMPNFTPTPAQVRALYEVIAEWAGTTVMVVQRANGFFNPARIGAGNMKRRAVEARSRTNVCPKVGNLLDWATKDVSLDVDINKEIRWAGKCI